MIDSDADTYHFRIDDEDDPFEGVLEAIQFVEGRDALELEPVGRVVDSNALDTLVSGPNDVTVSFTVEDLEVEVTSAGDIYVVDPTPDSFIHESVPGASNLLLQTRSHDHEACVDLLSVAPYDEESLLGVFYADSLERRVSAWEQYMVDQPAERAAIDVGDFPRSTTAGSVVGEAPANAEPVSYVPDASDLGKLQAAISERVSTLEASDRQLVVCFDSVTRVLQTTPHERAFQFLEDLTGRMDATDAVAHYHFDPEPFSAETEARVRSLFDACVVVHDDGDWTVQ